MDITKATKVNITSAKYIYDEPTDNPEHSIEAEIDGVVWYIQNPSVGNRHYEEIMRQVEAGELTIAAAD